MWYLIGLVGLFALYCIITIYRDMNRFVIRNYEVKSTKIKEKFTFVMLSDLHNQSFGKQNDVLCKAILQLNPDCVLTVGDLYTSKAGTNYDNAIALLRGLTEKLPVYVANGNHEHKTSENPKHFNHMYEKYQKELQAMGIHTLVNERIVLPVPNIDLLGAQIDLSYFRHFKKREMKDEYMESIAGKADGERFQILLAHNPIYFEQYAKWGADLVMSGHVHGGIIRLPFLGGAVSPAATLFPKYDGGLFEIGKSKMILGRGLGTHTIPVRLWNPGEVVFVTLLPEK